MIRPIITSYTSDFWGLNRSGLNDLDKLFLQYLCVLRVKATTSNVIVFGECGKFLPSMYCHANVLCYLHRLLTMQPGRIVKSVFNSLHDLNNQGFPSWVSRSYDLAESYQIDMESCIELSPYQFKELWHERLKNSFIMSWMTDLRMGACLLFLKHIAYTKWISVLNVIWSIYQSQNSE